MITLPAALIFEVSSFLLATWARGVFDMTLFSFFIGNEFHTHTVITAYIFLLKILFQKLVNTLE